MSDTPAPQTRWEANFIRQMKRMREEREWTQSALAEKVARYYGLKFHQPTIARIEAGERPARLDEAMAIAAIFRVPFNEMIADDVAVVVARDVKLLQRAHGVAEQGIVDALRISRHLEDLLESGTLTQTESDVVRDALSKYRVEGLVSDLKRRTVFMGQPGGLPTTAVTFDSPSETQQWLARTTKAIISEADDGER